MRKIIELKIEETEAVVGGLARAHGPSVSATLRAITERILGLPVAVKRN
jgi:hypothetical protein